MCSITDLKPRIEKGNLIATFKLEGEERELILHPFDSRVLTKFNFTLEEYAKQLIQKECLKPR